MSARSTQPSPASRRRRTDSGGLSGSLISIFLPTDNSTSSCDRRQGYRMSGTGVAALPDIRAEDSRSEYIYLSRRKPKTDYGHRAWNGPGSAALRASPGTRVESCGSMICRKVSIAWGDALNALRRVRPSLYIVGLDNTVRRSSRKPGKAGKVVVIEISASVPSPAQRRFRRQRATRARVGLYSKAFRFPQPDDCGRRAGPGHLASLSAKSVQDDGLDFLRACKRASLAANARAVDRCATPTSSDRRHRSVRRFLRHCALQSIIPAAFRRYAQQCSSWGNRFDQQLAQLSQLGEKSQ